MINLKNKLNPIPKSQRERKRYFKLVIKTSQAQDIKKIIYDEALNIYGILGYSKLGLQFIKDKKNVVKIDRLATNEFLNILNYINIKYHGITITCEKISGTIKGSDDIDVKRTKK